MNRAAQMRLSLALISLMSVCGCAPSPDAAGPRDFPTIEGGWRVEDVDDAGIIDGVELTVDFGADGRISGRSACNRYGGEYSYSSGVLTIGSLFSTKMACAPALMNLEAKFLDRLEGALTVNAVDADALSLEDEGGRILIRRAL